MQTSEIQWCDNTVNPVMGCAGCELLDVCYAHGLHRMRAGVKGSATAFTLPSLIPGRVVKAARWSDLRGTPRSEKPWLEGMPRMIFVSDMGDAPSEDRYVHEEQLEDYRGGQGRRRYRPLRKHRGGVPLDFLEREIMEPATSEKGSRHIWLWLTKRLLHFGAPKAFIPADAYAVDVLGKALGAGSWSQTSCLVADGMTKWYGSYLSAIHEVGRANANLIVDLIDLDARTFDELGAQRIRGLPKLIDKLLWWVGKEHKEGRHYRLFEEA